MQIYVFFIKTTNYPRKKNRGEKKKKFKIEKKIKISATYLIIISEIVVTLSKKTTNNENYESWNSKRD